VRRVVANIEECCDMSTSRALRRAVATGATVALASLGLVALVAVAPARADEVYPLPATGTITVHGHTGTA
jgi:hypothetical protein